MRENGPSLAFVVPSRPRRASNRNVAPIPPPRKKPAPSAPAATRGSFERSFAPMFVTSASPPRRSSTADASCSRSVSMSRRTCFAVRPLRAGIALQRFRSPPRLRDRLLGKRGGLADQPERNPRKYRGEPEQDAGRDQQRQPGRHRRRQRRGDRREGEAQSEEGEQEPTDAEGDADPEPGDLLLQLEDGKLELEPRQATRVLGDLLGGRPDAVRLSLAGGHVPSSRSLSRARCRRQARRRRPGTGLALASAGAFSASTLAAAAASSSVGRSAQASPVQSSGRSG